ncbi:amino acid ABC transporter substrate-binding protein [Lacinutrix salivirga]
MKKIIYILSFILLVSCGSTSQAQNYKTHKVQAGETIESIAKLYNVTSFDIYKLNPDARKSLSLNATLIIPKAKVATATNPGFEEVKELEGFKTHKVKRKETLYSLSKKYKVSQDEIKKQNPRLYAENLRKGDKIKIPIYKTKRVAVKAVEQQTTTYKVQPKEGKWRIAYKYGITTDELTELNPNMGDILQPGQLINVPNIAGSQLKEIDESYSYYTVLKAEGFYRLKVKLGLEQKELEKLNPTLKETGLKEGMVLKIPYNPSVRATNNNTEQGGATGEILVNSDLTKQINNPNTKHLVVMLPFKANRINKDSVSDAKRIITNDRYVNTSLDFHSGVLVALDSLKELGISIKVDVYDTRKEISEGSRIVRNNDFSSVDAVIGPLDAKVFNQVASDLKSKNIPVVSPLTKTVEVRSNVFQSRPSEDLLEEKIVNYIKKHGADSNIIIISDSKNIATSAKLKKEFPTAQTVSSRKDRKTGKEQYYIHDMDVMPKLKSGRNIVFLETKNDGFVSNVTSILNALIATDKEIILTTTDMNTAFEGEEVSNFHLSNLKFMFPTIAKMYNDEDSNSFAERYKKIYKINPSKVAVRGFDLTMDVVLRLATSEDLYTAANNIPLTSYVENKFAYKKKTFGGYYNDTVYLVRYDDLKIVEIIEED